MPLVVDGALLHFLVGNGVGLDGVELEVGRSGAEVGRGRVEFGQHGLQILRGDLRSDRGIEEHERCGDQGFLSEAHRLPFPVGRIDARSMAAGPEFFTSSR